MKLNLLRLRLIQLQWIMVWITLMLSDGFVYGQVTCNGGTTISAATIAPSTGITADNYIVNSQLTIVSLSAGGGYRDASTGYRFGTLTSTSDRNYKLVFSSPIKTAVLEFGFINNDIALNSPNPAGEERIANVTAVGASSAVYTFQDVSAGGMQNIWNATTRTISASVNSFGVNSSSKLQITSPTPFTEITLTHDYITGTNPFGVVLEEVCYALACNAGTTAPTLSGTTLSNVCPTLTANLNSRVTSTAPSGTSLVWFTNNAHTGTAYATPTTAAAGTYYAFYFDATNNCYSPATAAVTVTIRSCIQPPVAFDDYYITSVNVTKNISPQRFDYDPDNTSVRIVSINGIARTPSVEQNIAVPNGTVRFLANTIYYGSFIPATGFTGVVTFPYEISDENGATATANVNITVYECLTSVKGGLEGGGYTSTPSASENYYNDFQFNKPLIELPIGTLNSYFVSSEVYAYGNAINKTGLPIIAANTDISNKNAPELDNVYYYQETVNGKNLEHYIVIDRDPNSPEYISYVFAYINGIPTEVPYQLQLIGSNSLAAHGYSPVTVQNNNCPPLAVDDNYITATTTPVTLTPLDGDKGYESSPINIKSINGTNLTTGTAQTISVTNGTVNITAAGVITFTANTGFLGVATFPYIIQNTVNQTDTANIKIVVSPSTDTDNDGIVDVFDIDDDNDGILDSMEEAVCIDSFSISQAYATKVYTTRIAKTFTATNGTQVVATPTWHSGTPSGTSGFNLGTGNGDQNAQFDFSKPISDVKINLTSLSWDASGQERMSLLVNGTPWIFKASDLTLEWTTLTISNDGLYIIGEPIFDFGTATLNIHVPTGINSIRIYHDVVSGAPGGASYSLRVDGCILSNPSNITSNDLDKDGILNKFDLDSDGDGCPDAIEGGANLTKSNLVISLMAGGNSGVGYTGTSSSPITQNLGNTVDANGVPTIVGAGQTNGNSQNGTVQSPNCTACNAGTTAPSLSASTLSNTCPATTVNLNSLHTSTVPSGTSLVWFTNNAHTGTAYVTPTTAAAGTYYAFYFDATNNCYSPSTAAVMVTINDCNQVPVITSPTTATTPENVATTTPVYTATATDPNAGQTQTYSLETGGIDNPKFNINPTTGAVTFLVSPDFENPTDAGSDNVYNIKVKVCDNGTPQLCAIQDVAITVTDVNECITLNLKVILEGPYQTATGKMTTILNQRGLLPGQTPVGQFSVPTPLGQPYNTAPWNYTGTESFSTYPATVTDWVLVSVRTDSSAASTIFRKAGLLHNDGTVVFADTCWTLNLSQSYYVVVEHRNHLGVMSAQKLPIIANKMSLDFTALNGYVFTNPPTTGQKQVGSKWVMLAGESHKSTPLTNYDINFQDSQLWRTQSGIFDCYKWGDHNLDADVNFQDNYLWKINNGRYSGVPH
jgi:hypothetical protein